jgi:hypothetical protein
LTAFRISLWSRAASCFGSSEQCERDNLMTMKTIRLNPALCAGALLAVTVAAVGSPLQRADLPAEPAWVLHLDCDRLRPTAIGQYLLSEMEKPDAQAKLAAFQAIFSLDLRTQLHGLTLYNTGNLPQDGVLLVYADFDTAKLVALARAAKDSQSAAYKQHTIYNWIDEKKKPKDGVQPRVYAAIQGARVIFGQRETCVAQALDVLDGSVPALATSNTFPQLGAANATNFLDAAARKLNLRSSDGNAALFRLARVMRLQIGQTGQEVTATLNLDANDDEVAACMATIGQGVVALMKLQKEKPEVVKLAEAISLKHNGAGIVATLAMPAGDVVDMLKADAARKAQRKAQREAEKAQF